MTNKLDLLSQLDETFKEVSATTEFENLPDGEYLGRIETSEYAESKKGKPMIKTIVEVIYGEQKGRKEWIFHMLVGNDQEQLKRNLSNFKRQFSKLGINVDGSLSDAVEELDILEDLEVELKIETVKAKNGKEYRNVSLSKAD